MSESGVEIIKSLTKQKTIVFKQQQQQQQSPEMQQCPTSSSLSSEVIMFAHGARRDAKTCNKFAHDIESVEDLRLLPHMLSVTESPSTPFNRTASSVTGTMGTATELTTPRLKNYRNAVSDYDIAHSCTKKSHDENF